jgi:hypothetical protein
MKKVLPVAAVALASFSVCAARMEKPWAENRIVYNANLPEHRDGLRDDKDYFPSAWLERVAGCGMNGVWMRVNLRSIAKTSLTARTDEGERRIRKLRGIAKKCRDHGLALWIFGNEPVSFKPGDELLKAHPGLGGVRFAGNGWTMWCPSRPEVLAYIEEAVCDVFTEVPGLGGYLNIANGEGLTTCLDAYSDSPGVDRGSEFCPRCHARPRWQLHYDVSAAVVRGLKRADPALRYLSWFYHATSDPERHSWVYDCARHTPEGASFVYNFESGVMKRQLGRWHCGGDYWLSQPGPGAPYAAVAAAAAEGGSRLGAKIQTCSSHELASLPYVPAPGLLYRKYAAMKRCGVRDVVQSWYFGGEPSLMLKAAGELAHEDFSGGEEEFLFRFAREVFGEEAAPAAARVWKRYTSAYTDYPVCNLMQYYGPFHSGVSWPLHPEIAMRGLPRSWWSGEPEAGDLIGECLRSYTLDEAETITAAMAEKCGDGKDLAELAAKVAPDAEKLLDVGIMRAFRLHLLSARDAFRFYRLRRDAVRLGRSSPSRVKALVAQMKETVASARAATAELLPLAEADGRIGFHAEAATRIYNPETLRSRLRQLESVPARLDGIVAQLEKGGSWPCAERTAAQVGEKISHGDAVWSFREEPGGDLVFEGKVRKPWRRLFCSAVDLAGTRHPIVKSVTADGDGNFSFRLPAATWEHDPFFRPAWFSIAAVDERGSPYPTVSLWPEDKKPLRNRLCLPGLHPYRLGRLHFKD